MPEYLGFGLTFFTAAEDAEADIAAIEATGDIQADSASLEQVFELRGVPSTVLAASDGEDINTAVVRPDTADEFGLSTMSDLAAVQDDLRFGLPPDCETNVAGCKGAWESYGITWPPNNLELIPPCGAEMAGALEGNAIDVAWLCSTQPDIAQNGWIVLEDEPPEMSEELAEVQPETDEDAELPIAETYAAVKKEPSHARSRGPTEGELFSRPTRCFFHSQSQQCPHG